MVQKFRTTAYFCPNFDAAGRPSQHVGTTRRPMDVINHRDDNDSVIKICRPEYLLRKASLMVKKMVISGRFLKHMTVRFFEFCCETSKQISTYGDLEDTCCFIPAMVNARCEQG